MSLGSKIAAPTVALLLSAPLVRPAVEPPTSTQAQTQATGTRTSTLVDQTDLAVTVYNSNLALVRDVRQLELQLVYFTGGGPRS